MLLLWTYKLQILATTLFHKSESQIDRTIGSSLSDSSSVFTAKYHSSISWTAEIIDWSLIWILITRCFTFNHSVKKSMLIFLRKTMLISGDNGVPCFKYGVTQRPHPRRLQIWRPFSLLRLTVVCRSSLVDAYVSLAVNHSWPPPAGHPGPRSPHLSGKWSARLWYHAFTSPAGTLICSFHEKITWIWQNGY